MMPPPPTPRETPHREARNKRKRYDDTPEVDISRVVKKARPLRQTATKQIEPVEEPDYTSRVAARIELCDKMRELLTLYAEDIGLVDVDALEGCLIEMVCACTPSAAAHLRRQEMQDLKTQLESHWAEVTALQDDHTNTIEQYTAKFQEHTATIRKQTKDFQDEISERLDQQASQHQADMQILLAAINQRSLSASGEEPPPWSPTPAPAAIKGRTTRQTRRSLFQLEAVPELPPKEADATDEQINDTIIQRSYVRDVVDNIAIGAYNVAVACGMPTWLLGG